MCRLLIKFFILIYFVPLINCFNVEFRDFDDVNIHEFDTQIFKRELTQFFDKAAYSFNGLTKIESVPVMFPLDICILKVEHIRYAAALYKHKNGVRYFAVYKFIHSNYQTLLNIATPAAIALDCVTHATRGYIALTYNLTKPIESANEGSPIYEISATAGVRAVQYFAATSLRAMYLRVNGNDLTLLQAFETTRANSNINCQFFQWSGTTFDLLDRIPCSNARRLEPFTIDEDHYIAVANYADARGRTSVYSEIYKFNATQNQFQLFQRIRTHGAVDVKYFSVPQNEVKLNHFLIFGNSVSHQSTKRDAAASHNDRAGGIDKNKEADSVFYIYENGEFVPYQSLSFYKVERFLALQNSNAEKFLLLVACNKQDTKIYNLNDWKFEESKVQFTEGALSRGVARMRTYDENGQSFLVISNELMAENETNVFLPIYKQDEHANALRQQIIEWAAREIERLSTIDVERLKRDVVEKLAKINAHKLSAEKMANMRIERVETKSFISPHLGMHTNLWQALGYANRALDVLERELLNKNQQQQQRMPRATKEGIETVYEQNKLEKISVGTLIVRDKLQAKRINDVDTLEPQFEQVAAKKVYVAGNYNGPSAAIARSSNVSSTEGPSKATETTTAADVLHVENLQISGKLNGYTWTDLLNNTLKLEGVQFLKSSVNIKNMKTEAFIITNNEVSGVNLGELIPTYSGDYIVQQDVQFAAPIQVRNLRINERLNNIHVLKHRFDVLLKRANWTQVVEGPKRFENIKVMEPIMLAGRMLGKQLRAMAPMKVIHQDLQLVGDYIIDSTVSIAKRLSVSDVQHGKTNDSLVATLANAIHLKNETIENVNLNFMQPIKANNTLLSFVNTQDMQQLVQLNLDEVQIIEGAKTLSHSLTVKHGFSEVKQLNDINVEALDTKLLLKNAKQTISVPMHVGAVIAKGINAANITLHKLQLDAYLRHSGVQNLTANLNVNTLKVDKLQVQQLNTNGDIFGASLTDIYQQKSKHTPNVALLLQPEQKFHGSIYVRNLRINESLNDVSVAQLEQQLGQLEGNIKYMGDFKFKRDINFAELSFEHSINGITAQDFGNCWLQRNGAQNFTAPQSIAEIVAKSNLKLAGKLNGNELQRYFDATYRIDCNEKMHAVQFANPIVLDGTLRSSCGIVNGIKIPNDILTKKQTPQQRLLAAPLIIRGNLYVGGSGIYNTSSLNGLQLVALERYLSGIGYDTLHLEHVSFAATAPSYKTLNRHDLQRVLDNVWLANENVELMAPEQQVAMNVAQFKGLLDFEGTINNVNLAHLKENYFSLTKAQQIEAVLQFVNDVTYTHVAQPLEAMHVQLQRGSVLVDNISNSTINFDEFVTHTLKTSGEHHISEQWRILEAIIPNGDLENVLINNLNLMNDVLKANSTAKPTQITGVKRITGNATIGKLYATAESRVANVDVTHWIENAVYIYENHTIAGTTTLDTVNLYNDLTVAGHVNGQSFDVNNLLLCDREQHIKGDLIVRNYQADLKRILTHNVAELNVARINEHSVHSLLENQAKNRPNLHIESHLIFTQPVLVGNYEVAATTQQQLALDNSFKWKRGVEAVEEDLNKVTAADGSKKHAVQHFKKLTHFELRQSIPINVSAVWSLNVQIGALEQYDALGMLYNMDNKENMLCFYIWQETSASFEKKSLYFWGPQDQTQLDILRIDYELNKNIKKNSWIEFIKQPFSLHRSMPGLAEALKRKHALEDAELATLQLVKEQCFAIYGRGAEATIYIYCIINENGLPPTHETDWFMDDGTNIKDLHFNAKRIYELAVIRSEKAKGQVKQVLQLSATKDAMAILYDETVEIWTVQPQFRCVQVLHILHGKKMAVGSYAGNDYLAVISANQAQQQQQQSAIVEIYSNAANSFRWLQTIECAAKEVAFVALQESNDLLLQLNVAATQAWLVYQFKGVLGFQPILDASTLRGVAVRQMKLLQLATSGRYFTALLSDDAVHLVEIMLQEATAL